MNRTGKGSCQSTTRVKSIHIPAPPSEHVFERAVQPVRRPDDKRFELHVPSTPSSKTRKGKGNVSGKPKKGKSSELKQIDKQIKSLTKSLTDPETEDKAGILDRIMKIKNSRRRLIAEQTNNSLGQPIPPSLMRIVGDYIHTGKGLSSGRGPSLYGAH